MKHFTSGVYLTASLELVVFAFGTFYSGSECNGKSYSDSEFNGNFILVPNVMDLWTIFKFQYTISTIAKLVSRGNIKFSHNFLSNAVKNLQYQDEFRALD